MTIAEPAPGGTGQFLRAPHLPPTLDPAFRPAWLALRAVARHLQAAPGAQQVTLAVEREGGVAIVRRAWCPPVDSPDFPVAAWAAERLLKAMLWSRGGHRVLVAGSPDLADALRAHYVDTAPGRFDASLMGEVVYGRPFELLSVDETELPAERSATTEIGGHLDGCRIGFDLGASDRKVAAVIDGRVVFSEEVAWDPSHQPDPAWHLDQIMDSLRHAAAHLPRVDAIGGSAAGVYVAGEVRVASLFRAVPRDLFDRRVRGLFGELRRAWGDIPFAVLNDGEVTALAGAMLFGVGSLLGVAMGSSQAGGYVTADGRLTDWLNELAFIPLDLAPAAPVDEWSGDRGCGAQYLSQQAVARLLEPAHIGTDPDASLPQRLIGVQELMEAGDLRAQRIYETIGSYLGYALLAYGEVYEIENVLLLGRVLTGSGGEVIRRRAAQVLAAEDPASAERVTFRSVSERDKRHGQAVAAASLPPAGSRG